MGHADESDEPKFVFWYRLCVRLTLFHCLPCDLTYYSADVDVVFERDSTLYGTDSLDYIIAIPNHALQDLAVYLNSLQTER
jgi:hypothetical protein